MSTPEQRVAQNSADAATYGVSIQIAAPGNVVITDTSPRKRRTITLTPAEYALFAKRVAATQAWAPNAPAAQCQLQNALDFAREMWEQDLNDAD